ncbi:MAG TPA: hypothetical protein VLT33_41535, partial [Labilithrix sp.]|nr:hypothetical protein [Labilithrix sp.]
WSLTKSYGPNGRGTNCASSDSDGLPVAAGLIGLREAKAALIRHALRISLPSACVRVSAYVAPASHARVSGGAASAAPLGTRFRLRASFDISSLPSPGAKAVATALKVHGALVANVGSIPFLWAESDRLLKAADASLVWGGLLGQDDLIGIKPSDFEVVDFGSVQTGGGTCVRAP